MQIVCCLLWLCSVFPFWRAWQANRRTSLLHSVYWAMMAWTAWTVVAVYSESGSEQASIAGSYIALCLTGCAGVAVLGARRPGVAAWNFVIVGLLAVNLLPLAEGLILSKGFNLDWMRRLCVAATLAVGIVNYLPTRLGIPAVCLLAGSILVGWSVLGPTNSTEPGAQYLLTGWFVLALVPWLAWWALWSAPAATSEVDAVWFAFRDRFGFVWGQRLREQFNRSATHAGWPVILRWRGLRLKAGAALPDTEVQTAIAVTLRALMKRFLRQDEAQLPGT